jgi:hypothetical protein
LEGEEVEEEEEEGAAEEGKRRTYQKYKYNKPTPLEKATTA